MSTTGPLFSNTPEMTEADEMPPDMLRTATLEPGWKTFADGVPPTEALPHLVMIGDPASCAGFVALNTLIWE